MISRDKEFGFYNPDQNRSSGVAINTALRPTSPELVVKKALSAIAHLEETDRSSNDKLFVARRSDILRRAFSDIAKHNPTIEFVEVEIYNKTFYFDNQGNHTLGAAPESSVVHKVNATYNLQDKNGPQSNMAKQPTVDEFGFYDE